MRALEVVSMVKHSNDHKQLGGDCEDEDRQCEGSMIGSSNDYMQQRSCNIADDHPSPILVRSTAQAVDSTRVGREYKAADELTVQLHREA